MFVFHHSSCHSSYSRAVSLSLSSPSSQLYAYTLKVSVLFLLLTPYVKLVFISHYCCVQKNFIYFFKFFIKHTGLCAIITVLALLSHWKFSQSCVNLSPLTLSLSRYSSLYSSVRSSIPVNFLRILVGILCHATVIWVFFEYFASLPLSYSLLSWIHAWVLSVNCCLLHPCHSYFSMIHHFLFRVFLQQQILILKPFLLNPVFL